MDIRGIKLATGEELVANVQNTTAEHLVVRDPLLMRVFEGPQGLVCNFYPWTIIGEGDFKLNRNLVVSSYSLPKDVQDSYLQNVTGLAIVTVPPKQILNG